MMRILVTGGCGFIGSQLLRDLPKWSEEETLSIRILDNLERGRPEALMDLPDAAEYEFIEGDILDPAIQRAALRDVQAVIHLAATVRTPFFFDDPTRVQQVNRWGTSHLLESCLEANVDEFIFASTAAVYGPGGPHGEDAECEPLGAYARSKYKAEQAVQAADRRGLSTTILRFGTSYGIAPITRYEAVVNRFALLAGTSRPLTIHGDGTQKRPFIHVQDASDLLCRVLDSPRLTRGRKLNASSTNASILELANAIERVVPKIEAKRTKQDVRSQISLEIDNNDICSLGWEPSKTLEEGIQEICKRMKHLSSPDYLGDDVMGIPV